MSISSKAGHHERFGAAGLGNYNGAGLRVFDARQLRWMSCFHAMAMCDIGGGHGLFIAIGLVPLAGAMARERNRSSRRWLWCAVAVGPLAPLALLILGDAKSPAPAN